MLIHVPYPEFTYRSDIEYVWQQTSSGYYKTKGNASLRSVLMKGNQSELELCPLFPPGLGKGKTRINVRGDPPSLEYIIEQNPYVFNGGLSFPKDCTAQQKVAVIITYKDRWSHLLHLLHYLHPLLQKQQCHYRIFIVEQVTPGLFNKGRLYNVGFLTAMTFDQWDCVILHDVDLVPETEDNLYRCADSPLHLSAGVDSLRYTLMYKELVGGVLAMKPHHYMKANGFSNSFWGWGGEDDDMERRIDHVGLSVLHTSTQNGRYKMVPHLKQKPSPHRYKILHNENLWKLDGLNSMKFLDTKLLAVTNHRLYTNITVEVGESPDMIL
ncbi:hypothetical protein LSH36_260g01073 [Paralvinella palmiformis]|uniref:Beta-1,4-galactosyltransferase n=1 Tax=Paralvinella palmiformis TaxID=53620 RepID=A0AAD9JKC8_9ANNE|nr:hypothetical protein LSH36_260g01073 [Paralvinella palmiformis]